MTDRTLTAIPRPHPSSATVLAVSGELDHHTAPELTEAIRETSFSPETPVVIDLSDLSYCDSTGITVLVSAYKRAQQHDARLILVGLNPDLTRVFHIVGLNQIFTFRTTVDEAIDALSAAES
ncbi:STAS domain-containing protein [Actinomadura hibisca]|uniref:STAS domain-containing protein n=1 Tax=Actinomadura hibisca TaxID=68565 RepID=UPI000836EC89|nr:STAS domain-containing protein [Actinomadura hibisca]